MVDRSVVCLYILGVCIKPRKSKDLIVKESGVDSF